MDGVLLVRMDEASVFGLYKQNLFCTNLQILSHSTYRLLAEREGHAISSASSRSKHGHGHGLSVHVCMVRPATKWK